jgi:GNAT superfamily N-acetyltransferase
MNYSALESQRFGLNIFRGAVDEIRPYELLKTIVDHQVDVLIFRIPSTLQHTLHRLSAVPYPYLVTDTLVYYDCDLQKAPAQPLRNTELTARLATSADRALLETLIDEIFQDYSTHYYSNPLFDKQKILDGYKEWTLSYLSETEGKICFLFYRGEQPVAFATCGITAEYGEGVLYGVHPSAQGGGVYGDLIRYTKQHMQDLGLRKMLVSTQVQNFAVQKVWTREGFFLTQAYCTVHINAQLQQSLQALETA